MAPIRAASLLMLGLVAVGHAAALAHAPRRVKVNKYAKHSKADQVQRTLRFSNVAPPNAERANSTVGAAAYVPRDRSKAWQYPDAAKVDQRDPSTFGFTQIGIVIGAHGTQGEMKVRSDSDFAHERLCQPGPTWLRRPRRRAPREDRVLRGRKGPGRNAFLLTLASVRTREQASALRGATLHVRRELRPKLDSNELMLWELEDLAVVRAKTSTDEAGKLLYTCGETVGRVSGVIPREELTGSPQLGNDLIEVSLLSRGAAAADADESDDVGPDSDGDSVLVPFVTSIVVEVRLDEGVLLIDPPEGLLDLLQPKKVERVVVRGLLPPQAESLRDKEP